MSLLEELENKNGSSEEEASLSGGQVLSQAISNIPSSAAQLVSDVTMPFRHPIQTAQSLASLGRGIYQLATPGEQADEASAKAVGKFFADRYGTFEGFKRSFAEDPLGIVSDISAVLTGGAGLAAKIPSIAGKATTVISRVGNAIDPILGAGKAVSATTRAVGKAAAPVLGLTTGAGADAVRTAFEAGSGSAATQRLFLDNLRGDVSPAEVVPKAIDAFKDLGTQRKGDYRTNKAALKLDATPVDFSKVLEKIKAFEASKKYKNVSELSVKAQKKLREIKKIVAEWKRNPELHTAQGMDILKRRIDAEYPTGLEVGDAGMVVSEIRNSVRAQIISEVPEYGKVMRDYETAIRLEKQFASEMALGKNANAGTTLRKLQSAMRNNVNTAYGNRLEMLKKLDPDLVTEIGGQALSNIAPRGLSGIGAGSVAAYGTIADPSLLLGLPLQSPRLIGETAFKIGQASKALDPVLSSAATLPVARGARVVGEIEGVVDTAVDTSEETQELIRLLEKLDSEDKDAGFDGTEIGSIRSDALQLRDEFGPEDKEDGPNANIVYAADGGAITQGINSVVDDVIQQFMGMFSLSELQGGPVKKEIISLQRIAKQTKNPAFESQTLKKLHDLQKRLDASINRSNPNSSEQQAAMKMKEGLEAPVYNKIEQSFISGDTEAIDQLRDAKGLYNNYMGLGDNENIVDQRERASNKILSQITNKNYTPSNVVNLMFSHNQFAPSQSLPIVISKLRNSLTENEFVEVKDLLKDGVLTKAFSDDNNESTRSGIVKNYNNVFNNQKEIVNELFTKDEIAKVRRFKQNVLPTLSEQIKLNPSISNYTIMSALAKKDLLSSPIPSMDGSSLDAARQSLTRSREPLVVQPIDVAVDPGLSADLGGSAENLREIEKSIDGFQMPQSDQPIEQQGQLNNTQAALNLPLFEDMPQNNLGGAPSGFDASMSPTILPSASDREIAMRMNAKRSGIGSLV